jgi:hypothetical protein
MSPIGNMRVIASGSFLLLVSGSGCGPWAEEARASQEACLAYEVTASIFEDARSELNEHDALLERAKADGSTIAEMMDERARVDQQLAAAIARLSAAQQPIRREIASRRGWDRIPFPDAYINNRTESERAAVRRLRSQVDQRKAQIDSMTSHIDGLLDRAVEHHITAVHLVDAAKLAKTHLDASDAVLAAFTLRRADRGRQRAQAERLIAYANASSAAVPEAEAERLRRAVLLGQVGDLCRSSGSARAGSEAFHLDIPSQHAWDAFEAWVETSIKETYR